MKWADQYKHPLWQKKRLEALDKAGYSCVRCGCADSTLHVHHNQYFKGRMIWEYSLDELSVLCEACHSETHQEIDALKVVISRIQPDAIGELTALIAGYCSLVRGPATLEAGLDDAHDRDPYSFHLGKVVAAMSNKTVPIGTLIDLVEKIECADISKNTPVEIILPKRRHFFGC